MNKTGRPRSLLFTTMLLSWDTRAFAQPPVGEAGDEPWVCGGFACDSLFISPTKVELAHEKSLCSPSSDGESWAN